MLNERKFQVGAKVVWQKSAPKTASTTASKPAPFLARIGDKEPIPLGGTFIYQIGKPCSDCDIDREHGDCLKRGDLSCWRDENEFYLASENELSPWIPEDDSHD